MIQKVNKDLEIEEDYFEESQQRIKEAISKFSSDDINDLHFSQLSLGSSSSKSNSADSETCLLANSGDKSN